MCSNAHTHKLTLGDVEMDAVAKKQKRNGRQNKRDKSFTMCLNHLCINKKSL